MSSDRKIIILLSCYKSWQLLSQSLIERELKRLDIIWNCYKKTKNTFKSCKRKNYLASGEEKDYIMCIRNDSYSEMYLNKENNI